MVVAYFGLVAVVVITARINNEVIKRESAQAAATSRCLASRPVLLRISTHFTGVNILARLIVENRATEVRFLRKGDPRRAISLVNLKRSQKALKQIQAIQKLDVPTVVECETTPP